MTIIKTDHFVERQEERGFRTREMQRAIKHGEKMVSPTGNLMHVTNEAVAVTDPDGRVAVTGWLRDDAASPVLSSTELGALPEASAAADDGDIDDDDVAVVSAMGPRLLELERVQEEEPASEEALVQNLLHLWALWSSQDVDERQENYNALSKPHQDLLWNRLTPHEQRRLQEEATPFVEIKKSKQRQRVQSRADAAPKSAFAAQQQKQSLARDMLSVHSAVKENEKAKSADRAARRKQVLHKQAEQMEAFAAEAQRRAAEVEARERGERERKRVADAQQAEKLKEKMSAEFAAAETEAAEKDAREKEKLERARLQTERRQQARADQQAKVQKGKTERRVEALRTATDTLEAALGSMGWDFGEQHRNAPPPEWLQEHCERGEELAGPISNLDAALELAATSSYFDDASGSLIVANATKLLKLGDEVRAAAAQEMAQKGAVLEEEHAKEEKRRAVVDQLLENARAKFLAEEWAVKEAQQALRDAEIDHRRQGVYGATAKKEKDTKSKAKAKITQQAQDQTTWLDAMTVVVTGGKASADPNPEWRKPYEDKLERAEKALRERPLSRAAEFQAEIARWEDVADPKSVRRARNELARMFRSQAGAGPSSSSSEL